MAEFPALPLWTDAYLADCGHLSDVEHGRYLLILMHLWRSPDRRFPNDVAWLARKFGRSVQAFEIELLPLMREFMQSDGNWWTQKRLSAEWEYVKKTTDRQRASAKARWNKKKAESHGNAALHASGNAPTPTPTPTPISKNIRSKGRKALLNGHLQDFELWFAAYPRHVARGAAERAFVTAIKIATVEELTAGAQRYARTVTGTEQKFIAHPATWLNQKRWLDSDGVSKPRGPKAPAPAYLVEQGEEEPEC